MMVEWGLRKLYYLYIAGKKIRLIGNLYILLAFEKGSETNLSDE